MALITSARMLRAALAGKQAQATPAQSTSHASRISYRPDIDGLRALAVWPVVLFHSELGIVSGGFVGVDIFFVISGYLITNILLKDIAAGDFSPLDFYAKRVRRIFPALFAMLAVCAVLGAAIMLPRDFETLGLNIAAASASLSNFALLSEVDYFEGDAKLKPLLHTWSLALEEQFYILWPLLLIFFARWRRRWLLLASGSIALASFAASAWFIGTEPDDVFYLLWFRSWELLLGGLLAAGLVPAFTNRQLSAFAAALGFAMIIYAVVAFSEQMQFPGLAALVPCIGAALIIHAGQHHDTTAVAQLLGSPVMTFFGKISYSFYLWHWPLFAFLRYMMIDEPGPGILVYAVVPLALVCATLSWRFIERPFRYGQQLKTRRAALSFGTGAIACGVLVGSVFYVGKGIPQRFSAEVNQLSGVKDFDNPYKICSWRATADDKCLIGDAAEPDMMLWGDSHAGALWPAADELAEEGHTIRYAGNAGCPALLDIGTNQQCIAINRRLLRFAIESETIHTVILSGRWSLYFQGRALSHGPAETNSGLPELMTLQGESFEQFTPEAQAALGQGIAGLVHSLTAAGKRVVLVYPSPEIGYDVPFTAARLKDRDLSLGEFGLPKAFYRQRQSPVFEMLDAIGKDPLLKRIYPADALCSSEHCPALKDGEPLYTDSNHLSPAGAHMLLPLIRKALVEHPR